VKAMTRRTCGVCSLAEDVKVQCKGFATACLESAGCCRTEGSVRCVKELLWEINSDGSWMARKTSPNILSPPVISTRTVYTSQMLGKS